MNPNREEALFALALEKPAEKRAAFLDAMCDGDAALRQRLDALLAAHEQPDDRVESLVQRDPANGLSQELLANLIQEEGKGWMKLAGSPGNSRARQAEFWQQAIAALTRCQEKLDSPQLEQMPPSQLTQQRNDVASALNEARNAAAKLGAEATTNSSSK